MTYSTHAIILRRRDYGEWDRLYTVYTRERGKLMVIGKGTRRPKAKLASHLEPFYEVDLVVAVGRAIDRVVFARVLHAHASIAESLERAQCASFLAECVDRLVVEPHRDVALFDLLRDALDAVEQRPADLVPHQAPLATPFTLRLLSILGYTPQLDRCVECRTSIAPGPTIGVPSRGGIACTTCATSIRNGIPLTADDHRIIADAAASFRPFSPSPATTTFAVALLEAHMWQPLRTSPDRIMLTRAQDPATVAAS